MPAGGHVADGLVFSLTDTRGVTFTVEFNDVSDGRRWYRGSVRDRLHRGHDAAGTAAADRQRAINGLPFDIVAQPSALPLVSFAFDTNVGIFAQIQIDIQTSPLTALLQNNNPPVAEETLLIPATGYVDGQTFVISDGQTLQVFEFDDGGVGRS